MIRIATVLLLAVAPALADVPTITDGDTLRLDGERVRLWGIDAPERGQPGGPEATHELLGLAGMGVTCQPVEKDRYGRTVAKCFDRHGVDVGREMVRRGRAWDYTEYSGGAYAQDQYAAQAAGVGLWAAPGAVPPWQWRKN